MPKSLNRVGINPYHILNQVMKILKSLLIIAFLAVAGSAFSQTVTLHNGYTQDLRFVLSDGSSTQTIIVPPGASTFAYTLTGTLNNVDCFINSTGCGNSFGVVAGFAPSPTPYIQNFTPVCSGGTFINSIIVGHHIAGGVSVYDVHGN
jgi:hypothetical protein